MLYKTCSALWGISAHRKFQHAISVWIRIGNLLDFTCAVCFCNNFFSSYETSQSNNNDSTKNGVQNKFDRTIRFVEEYLRNVVQQSWSVTSTSSQLKLTYEVFWKKNVLYSTRWIKKYFIHLSDWCLRHRRRKSEVLRQRRGVISLLHRVCMWEELGDSKIWCGKMKVFSVSVSRVGVGGRKNSATGRSKWPE